MLNSKRNRIVLVASAFIVVLLFLYAFLRDRSEIIELQKARELLSSHSVQKVIATEDYVYLKTASGVYKVATSQVDPEMFAGTKVSVGSGANTLYALLGLVVVLGVGTLLFRRWQKSQPKAPAKRAGTAGEGPEHAAMPIRAVESDVTFSDIGGIADVKVELEEIIDFLRNPSRYRKFGAYMPRGVLLVGPPGVGKTMIAKAVAAEADVPFYYQSGASFVQIYVGMGAKRVHELFRAAKSNAPAIIFIDEIDAVGKQRDGSRNDEREATLNQLLTEMDGFESTSGVIVVAATNKIDVLDSALLRAGRFDRRVFVDLPTPIEREAILSKYLTRIPHNVEVADLARMTIGFNGASLAALVNEAALLSLRQHDLQVTMEHFHQVKDKVMYGKKRIPVLSEEQKAYRARYQAGKAFVAAWFDLPFEKVLLSSETIKPPISEPMLKHEIEARIKMLLAGMAACELRFKEHATNAKEDIAQAREMVQAMLEDYAMGDSLFSTHADRSALMDRLYEQTRNLIGSHEEAIERIETVLVRYESISKELIKENINAVL